MAAAQVGRGRLGSSAKAASDRRCNSIRQSAIEHSRVHDCWRLSPMAAWHRAPFSGLVTAAVAVRRLVGWLVGAPQSLAGWLTGGPLSLCWSSHIDDGRPLVHAGPTLPLPCSLSSSPLLSSQSSSSLSSRAEAHVHCCPTRRVGQQSREAREQQKTVQPTLIHSLLLLLTQQMKTRIPNGKGGRASAMRSHR